MVSKDEIEEIKVHDIEYKIYVIKLKLKYENKYLFIKDIFLFF